MLTPLEIENKKFKKELIGYSVAEVEEFVQLVTESYETIYKENLANRDKINMLSSAIKQYKTMEETLQNAILVAQSAGEEVTRNAKAKAENIINEAQNSAAQILADAGKEVTKVSYEYEEMKRNVEVFRTRIISLLTSQLDIVKEFSMPESGKRAEEKAVETAPGAEDTTVLFCFGGNDCDYNWKSICEGRCDYEHRHRVAPQDFKKNYEDMIHLLQEKGAAVTAVIAPPIAIEVYLSYLLKSGVDKDIMSEYVNSVQQMQDEYAGYDDIMRDTAKENGCEILSLRESFLALGDMKAYYSKDGMHPNEAGYALIRGDFEKYFASAAGII